MSPRAARRLLFTLLALYTVSLTYPGIVPFNRIEPLVLGLPFVMFWHALWIVLVGAGLALMHAAESRAESSATSLADATSPDSRTRHDPETR